MKPKKSLLKLTKRQEETMKRHKEHHTSKHMKAMRKSMMSGSTFGSAHKKVMKEVGS